MKQFYFIFLIICVFSVTQILKGDITVHLGPAGVGGGGTNPLSIPPTNPLDYSVIYLTKKNKEWSFSLVPGVFYGQRYKLSQSGAYLSLGGGLVIHLMGMGPGVFSALGHNFCGEKFCFNIEYRSALGYGRSFFTPYAFRIGVNFINRGWL